VQRANAMKKPNALALVSVLASLVSASSIAAADVIGPDEQACQGRVANDPCITSAGTAGRCTSRTVPVGNPADDASRVALWCISDGDAGADSGVGAEPPPNGAGCRCSTVAHTNAGAHNTVALFSVAAALALSARRARRRP
jgi:hypothetical protein